MATSLKAGIDEAGRGPLAGPVTAACVIFPVRYRNSAIGDSKQLTPEVRETLYIEITKKALAFSIVSIGPRRIDRINILQATRRAMILSAERAIKQLRRSGHEHDVHLLIDGNQKLDTYRPQRTIIKGDALELSIGAASILAKVARDRMMSELHARYPAYEFAKHKGYGTKLHLERIREHGPCPVHRFTFAGVRGVDNPSLKLVGERYSESDEFKVYESCDEAELTGATAFGPTAPGAEFLG